MCYYAQTYVHCGHTQKLPLNRFECTPECKAERENKLKVVNEATDISAADKVKKTKKIEKEHGKFLGELKPLKEGWCPICLIQQKATIFDQIGSDGAGLGNVLKQIINREEPQLHPSKVRQVTERDEVDEKENDDKQKKHQVVTAYAASYKVPKWELKWEDKTRGDMKREINEKKMELVDRIRVLYDVMKENKIDTIKLEERVLAQTDQRKIEEKKRKEAASVKRENLKKEREEALKLILAEKRKAKVEKFEAYLEHLKKRDERILYHC